MTSWRIFAAVQVRHAVRHEYACTAVDVLARRLGVTFVDAHAAECMIRRVVDLMAVELGWGMHERERQVHQASRFLEEQMGLSVCRPHRHAHVLELDSNEFGRLVRLFEYLDRRQVRHRGFFYFANNTVDSGQGRLTA